MSELNKLSALIDKQCKHRSKVLQSSTRALKRLQTDNDTNKAAIYLANICVELDDKFGVGSTLCLNWMLEHYMVMEFERRIYPRFLEIWEALRNGGYTYKNQYNYFDAEAFYIPHEAKSIIVMGSWWKYGGTKSLVIDDLGCIFNKFYVRKIWKRTRMNCIDNIDRPTLSFYRKFNFVMSHDSHSTVYADCRDNGHVLTYVRGLVNNSKCDSVIWNLNDHIQWFFQVNSLWDQLVNK